MITGYVDGKSIGQKDDKVDGVLVLTPTRLVFYHQKMLGIGKHSSEEYFLHKINSINLDSGLVCGGSVRITGSGNDLKVKCGLTDQNPAAFVKK